MGYNLEDFIFINRKLCPLCREEFYHRRFLCDSCRKQLEDVKGTLVLEGGDLVCRYPYFYNRFLREQIRRFKFLFQPHLYKAFGELMVDYGREGGLFEDLHLLCYVPMHPSEENRRGYNQAKLLAEHISRRTGIPVTHSLKKLRKTREQNKLSEKERRRNLDRAFAVEDASLFFGKRVLIVDDIVTTGSTMEEIGKMLLSCEAESIQGLVLASGRPEELQGEGNGIIGCHR